MYGFWFPISVFLLIHLFLSDSMLLLSFKALSTKFVFSAGNKQINQPFWLPEIQDFFKQIYFARSDWLQNLTDNIRCSHKTIRSFGHASLLVYHWMMIRHVNVTWVVDLHPFGVPHTFYCTTCPLVDLRINSNKKILFIVISIVSLLG